MLIWPAKDPDETLDFGIDWSDRLGGDLGSSGADTIATSEWILGSDSLTKVDEDNDETTTTIVLSGGSLNDPVKGTLYYVTNRITTTSGLVMDETVRLRVRTK